MAAMVGGGIRVRPGEISLAHLGVLFLDELPEFQRPVLEALRAPLETGSTLIARANAHVRYPSRVQLVAAMNPCRCGFLADPAQACSKAPRCGADYQARISGPIFDRIDLHVDVPAVKASDLALPAPREGSQEVGERVAKARAVQKDRFAAQGLRCNAEAEGDLLDRAAALDAPARALLVEAADRMKLSARGFHRVQRVARTIADLAGAGAAGRIHVAEALSFRRLHQT
jgi:magnesium chelatase family protein